MEPLKPGWAKKQIDDARLEAEKWPKWLRIALGLDIKEKYNE